jgi:hypothetical protein
VREICACFSWFLLGKSKSPKSSLKISWYKPEEQWLKEGKQKPKGTRASSYRRKSPVRVEEIKI